MQTNAGNIRIEICCNSAEDVYTAAAAGADQVELNTGIALGGLTASVGAVRAALGAGLPIMAMVRPREGGFCYTQHEFAGMLADADALLQAGATGIVFGVLHPDSTIDADRTLQMVQAIGPAQSIFHRAFDTVPSLPAALDTLIELGITRVLSSGGAATAPAGAAMLRRLVQQAAGRIEILAGSGIRADNAAAFAEATGCPLLHASCGEWGLDEAGSGNAAVSFVADPPPTGAGYKRVNPAAAAALVQVLHG